MATVVPEPECQLFVEIMQVLVYIAESRNQHDQ